MAFFLGEFSCQNSLRGYKSPDFRALVSRLPIFTSLLRHLNSTILVRNINGNHWYLFENRSNLMAIHSTTVLSIENAESNLDRSSMPPRPAR